MQNRIFIKCLFISIIGGALVHLRSLLLFSDTPISQSLMQTGFSTYLVKMGNSFQTAFLPGLAAGFAGLMMVKKLRLWQGCFLCLTLPFFDVFFQCVVFPLLSSDGSGSVHLSAVAFNYVVSYTYSFSIFFIALVFYGIHAKDKLITLLCVSWNIFRYFLLYLIPPLFPQFNLEQLRMDEGELTHRSLSYGLAYAAIILLLFFIIYDLRKTDDRKLRERIEKLLAPIRKNRTA